MLVEFSPIQNIFDHIFLKLYQVSVFHVDLKACLLDPGHEVLGRFSVAEVCGLVKAFDIVMFLHKFYQTLLIPCVFENMFQPCVDVLLEAMIFVGCVVEVFTRVIFKLRTGHDSENMENVVSVHYEAGDNKVIGKMF